MKVMISGGGTGGHIYPAIAIANAIKAKHSDTEFRFVGVEGHMEMDKVPAAGYEIVLLHNLTGLDRKNKIKNIHVLWQHFRNLRLMWDAFQRFKPDIVIGVGGYVTFPPLLMARLLRIPILLQEQNSLSGKANKFFAKGAKTICVAYEGMEKFFPRDKIVLTGNPVRQDLVFSDEKRSEGYVYFGLNPNRKTVLIIGGSLGAKTLIDSVLGHLNIIESSNIQFILQTGKQQFSINKLPDNIIQTNFISRMDLAYSVADLIVSRAGAGSISEFCLLSKPTILVPSPNVAEDHQTKNAEALVLKNATILIPDKKAVQDLILEALKVVQEDTKLQELSINISKLAKPDAANEIVKEIEMITNKKDRYFKLNQIPNNIYFIGIGGIGMSNLARYFISEGKIVAGYDRTRSDLTQQLEREGALIHYEENDKLIPKSFKNKKDTLIIFTPAITDKNLEYRFFQRKGFILMKRAQVLGEITKTKRSICVAGTHGKTTTSSMIAHLLKQSHVDCNAFLGGILKNYNTNLLLSKNSELTVIEADEYDRSFLWLNPYMAVITAVTPDHLDIYGTEENYRKAFIQFSSLIKQGGVLLMENEVDIEPKLQNNVRLYRYTGSTKVSFSKENRENVDFYADNIRFNNGGIIFDFITPNKTISDIRLGVPMQINITNGIAALAIAYLNGLSDEELRDGMSSYQGVKRRFDLHIEQDNLVLIDDYAHHPEELEASVSSVRKRYPNRKLTVVFQPHLYSRTRDFYHQFAKSLSLADEVILLPIYPAREEPIPGVSSRMILDLVTAPHKKLVNYNDLVDVITKEGSDVLLITGAGDIELLIEPVKNKLNG
jgi:UDP-N-acetylmuramate--alanine ligase